MSNVMFRSFCNEVFCHSIALKISSEGKSAQGNNGKV